MNFFDDPGAAARYANARPYFHALVAERLQRWIGTADPIALAIDVGCDTGQSAIALAGLAQRIVAVDSAAAMLGNATPHPQVTYVHSTAEHLPAEDAVAQLVTVGSAFHWFDRALFLREVRRVLRPNGWLAIFNDSFAGEMRANPAYAAWNREHYVARYPTPPRDAAPFTDAAARAYGLERRHEDAFFHDVTFTPAALATYLTTQTNVLAAIDGGRESADGALAWLLAAVEPLFAGPDAIFPFRCRIDVFQRT